MTRRKRPLDVSPHGKPYAHDVFKIWDEAWSVLEQLVAQRKED